MVELSFEAGFSGGQLLVCHRRDFAPGGSPGVRVGAEAGGTTIRLTPNTANLNLTTFNATLSVSINGSAEFDVDVDLTLRNPILRVVQSGGGEGSAWADYYDNAAGRSYSLGSFNTENGTFSFEAEVPYGEGVYLNGSGTECSSFNGFFLGGKPILPDPETLVVGPLTILEDTTIEANYLMCSTCAVILFTLNIVGLIRTRPRNGLARGRAGRRG